MSALLESWIVRREMVAADTLACSVRRPAAFTFDPGQYVEVTLLRPPFDDSQGPTRAMSIASAPEDDDLLLLMRLRDTAFKRSIASLPIGAPVLLDGPADDLRFEQTGRGHFVMVAGGVGIAPFRAALRRALTTDGQLDATLFYSNRRPEDAAYLAELCDIEQHVRGLRVVPTMTRMSESTMSWYGETERLSAPMIARYVPDFRDARFYVSGSTSLISGLCQDLERAGVSAGHIRVELYAGY